MPVSGGQNPEVLSPFERCAQIAEQIGRLPAVATLSWPDLAAACVARITAPSRAVVMLACLHGDGAVAAHEATGVASFGTTGTENAADRQQAELTLRSRCERLSEIGFRPGTLDAMGRAAAAANEVVLGPTWRDTGLGRIWAGLDASDLVVGAARISGLVPSRFVIVQVAALGTSESRPRLGSDEVSVLNAVMPVLARRTLVAVGAEKTTASSWLTVREQQVLDELTLGKNVREIAEVIERSPHTVHDHVKSLHKKLKASSRGELVARALGHSIGVGSLAIETGEAKPSGRRALDPNVADAVRGEATPPVDRAEPKPNTGQGFGPGSGSASGSGVVAKPRLDGLDTTIG